MVVVMVVVGRGGGGEGGSVIYLFIICLFIACLCVCFLITLREQLCGLAPWGERGEGRNLVYWFLLRGNC